VAEEKDSFVAVEVVVAEEALSFEVHIEMVRMLD
jgi:hypothetical protein